MKTKSRQPPTTVVSNVESIASDSADLPARTDSAGTVKGQALNLTPGHMHVGIGLRGIDGALGVISPFLLGPKAGGTTVVSLSDVFGELASMVMRVQDGNLSDLECVLATQAFGLNLLATEMLQRAAHRIDRPDSVLELYARLGLKMQNQARMAIETLGELKNPRPVLIARQANVTAGLQQINNAPQVASLPSEERSRTNRKRKAADRSIGAEE